MKHLSWVLMFAVGCAGEITLPPGSGDEKPDSPDDGGKGDDSSDPGDGPRVGVQFTLDDELYVNPERGFTVIVDPTDLGDLQSAANKGVTLVNALAHLDAYRDQDLPSEYLDQLTAGFEEARALGLKMVLRFRYDDGDGRDAAEAQLLRHIDQLEPLLREHAGVIAVVQAGFIGAWGEWHASANGLDTEAGRGTVMYALLDALPESRSIQLRTPHFKDEQFPGGPLTETEALSGADIARVGHHNDCFLSSATDKGTYRDPIEEWTAYVAQESRFTPVGGETCDLFMPRSGCDSALAEMAELHYSYLNKTYYPAVIDDWRAEGCYDEIERRLGYRFELVSASWPETVTAGAPAAIQIAVRNTGFATPFNERPVYLVLEGGGDRVELPIAGADPRRWEAGAETLVNAVVEIPDLPAGTYRMSLWLPDADPGLAGDSAFAVRMANQDTWRAADGSNVLTESLAISTN